MVLTGAGISADSGLPTFRDAGGLWEGEAVEDVATPEAWHRDPARVWRFYQRRRARLREVEPNAAHRALARLAGELAACGGSLTLVSQNVDDLHQRAGSPVLAVHGQLRDLRCEACGDRLDDLVHLDPDAFVPCTACGFPRRRPDVVWFGEVPRHLAATEDAVLRATCFAAIGTSGVVYPAAGLLALARSARVPTWVLSLAEPENLHPRDRFRAGRAAEVVPGWVDELLAGAI